MQNYTQEFKYDELGNMLELKSNTQITRNYYYNFANNNYLLGNNGTTEYTYDAHGNMLTMPHLKALHWNYNDWLTSVELDQAGNKAYYVYDSSGERTRKVVEKGNIKEERYYFGDFEIYRKFTAQTLTVERTICPDLSGTLNISDSLSRFFIGNKAKIATVDKLVVNQGSLIDVTTSVIRYQYDNHLGSASLELDDTANIISYEEYHPFGTTSYRSGKTETETSQKRYKYVGKERDEETGLYYYGARYYAAWICRFVSVDPLQFDYPYYTPFQYAGNKPITYIDLDGLEEFPNPFANVSTRENPVIFVEREDEKLVNYKKKYSMTKSNSDAWPVKTWKGSGWNVDHGWFGEKRKKYKDGKSHEGIDINSNLGGNSDLGAPIYSTHEGIVQYAKSDYNGKGGAYVYLLSPNKSFRTAYMHFDTVIVKKGDKIKKGQQLGTMGGSANGERLEYPVHLHYELHELKNGLYYPVNPEVRRGVLVNTQDRIDFGGLTLSGVKKRIENLELSLDIFTKSIIPRELMHNMSLDEMDSYYDDKMQVVNSFNEEISSQKAIYNKLMTTKNL